MATLTHAESRRLYSWWWDSHISPKNSKWLQENLTDMDVKVKSMIKLIEEDADSFRKRAEMYYRKRPELLKLVEEFYRAYRALAERYDHATGALRQAHRTMAEAFPDQLPLMLSDESPSGSSAFDADESQKDDFDMSFHTNNIKGKELLSEENAVTNSEEHASKSETEIENLKGTVSEVEAEKEAVLSQNQLSQERVSSLETEIYRMQEEFKKLNEEMILGLTKLKGAEERCIFLEKENQSFQLELDTVKEERRKQQEELDSKQEELEKLNISVKDEISFLEESKRKLEDEVKLLVGEKRAIQQEVYSVKEDKKDLEQRHQKLTEELTAANINIESFQELVNKLQGENVELKEKCKKHEDEKTELLEKLKYVESIKEKNGVLEDSLSIANAELNELREKVEVIAQNMEKLSDKNTLLESSLAGVNLELEVLQEKLNASEESCRFLKDQNSVLFAEKSALETKVEIISNSLKSLEGRHTELEGKYLNLEKEKPRILDQVTELQYYLKLEKEEHGTLMLLSRNQLAIFENLIQEKDKLREEELEEEYIKTLQSQIEILALHNCLYDMKEQKQIFSDKCQKYLESSKCKEEHMSMLYHEIEDQKTSISEAEDDILRLSLEKSVILSLFVQFGAEAAELMSQKNSLEQDSKARLEELLLLNEQIEMGKNLLVQKDWELFQANHKLQAMQDKNTELSGNIESLLMDINEAKVESKELESNNLKLLEYHTYRDNEIAGLRQANDTLNRLLENLYGEMQELKDKEVHLTQEVKSCEAEIETLLNDIQIKTVNSTILEEKMKEKLGSVDVENRNMKKEPSAYLPLVMSLSDCVQSLEGHIVSLAKHHSLGNQEPKSSSPSLQQKWNTEVGNEDHSAMETFGIFLLQNLHVKVSALEKMVKDIQGHPEQNRLQAEIREIEGLKSDGTLDLQELRTSNMLSLKIRRETSNATRGNTENLREKSQRIMKDIQLDPVSSPLQYGDWSSSHGPGVDTDERYTARSSNGTDGTVDFNNMEKPLLVSLKHKKELSTDKLKLSSKIKDSHQEWIGSISERLSSDFERLSFLQKSAKELKKTTEVSELSKGPISSKFKQFKEQVKEAEEAILQLVDMNNKLTKKTEKLSSSSSSLLSEQNDEIENASERKISERARKGSEKIGRLELEMQKLEYIWLKLKEEHDYKKAIASERKRPRVLLRDYLYGGRESPRRKRVSWCGCMRTRTKEN